MANNINQIAYGQGIAPYKMQSVVKKDYYTAKEGVPGFPKDIPLYEAPGLKPGEIGVKWYGPKKTGFDEKGLRVGTQTTNKIKCKDAVDYYMKEMPARGWKTVDPLGPIGHDGWVEIQFINKNKDICEVIVGSNTYNPTEKTPYDISVSYFPKNNLLF